MAKPVKRASIPVAAIVIAFIVFWPAGIGLLALKLSSDRSAAVKTATGKALTVAAAALTAMGCLAVIAGAVDAEWDAVLGGAIFAGVGTALLLFALRLRKTGQLYRAYIDSVANRGRTDISEIAADAGTGSAQAAADLRKMISLGYFRGAVLDEASGTITVPRPQGGGVLSRLLPATAQQQGAVAARAQVCRSCGAYARVIPGMHAECEYCGTPL